MILGDGSSGTADTTWGAASRERTRGKFGGGGRCGGTSHRLFPTARLGTSGAADASVKHCFTGLTPIDAPQALTLTNEPKANVERYDGLRKTVEVRHAS
jgi:hypothetical protein